MIMYLTSLWEKYIELDIGIETEILSGKCESPPDGSVNTVIERESGRGATSAFMMVICPPCYKRREDSH